MTVQEKRKALDDYCTLRPCDRCKIGVKFGDGKHPCGNGYTFIGMHAVDDATVEKYYDIVFEKEKEKEKTITLNEEQFVDLCAKATADLVFKHPKLFVYNDLMIGICSLLTAKLFHEKEGE